jgi:2-polyprenyl-3-methyl-5-hydroxy-6-metoxy-1,4-benzoquinol methylase
MPAATELTTTVCRHEHFRTHWLSRWSRVFGHYGFKHRKVWEWAAIAQALLERDKLCEGQRGLGFAVGQEPLSSVFASYGCEIVATDYTTGDVAQAWDVSGQNARSLDAVFKPTILSRERFDGLVRFQHADMNDLSTLERGHYDFIWSSCALEHLGSLERGMTFVRDAMQLLKPGGVAVHTTEYNVSSQTRTIETGGSVIYRRCDLEQLDCDLRPRRACLEPLDLYPGCEPEDLAYDVPPYQASVHLKLELDGFICTSALLVCRQH